MDHSEKKCAEDERKSNEGKGNSSKTVNSSEMAENKVDNDEQLHSEKLASKESQQHTNKKFDGSEIGKGKSEETSTMKSSDKMHTTTSSSPNRHKDNSATGESRSDTTDIKPGTVSPTEKASSGEVKSNPDTSKSTENANKGKKPSGDEVGSTKTTDKPSSTSTPTEKTDSMKPEEKNDTIKPADKTDSSKSTVKTDNSNPTDKTCSSKPTDKADSKATDKPDNDKPADNTDSKPRDRSDSSKATDKTNDEKSSDSTGSKPSKEPDTVTKTSTSQEKGNNTSNKFSNSNDTTAKALNSNSSQETKLPDNGLTPKDIQATLAQEEEYDGLNMNSSDATEETIPLKHKEEEQETEKKDGMPARWILAVLGCIGFMIVYGLKVNLSVAIIAMVNHTAVAEMSQKHSTHDDDDEALHHTGNATGEGEVDECGNVAKKEELTDGPFPWDETVQGIILASYFYGYIVTQVPGGWVAEKFSAKHVFGTGALINAICAIITPVAANTSYIFLIILRIIMGIAGGVTLPGMHVLIASWAPPAERSKIASTIYAGMTLGTLVCMPFSGLLAASLDWTAIFYVQGSLSLLWYVLWLIFVFDSPSQHPRISRSERRFIEESLGTVVKSKKPPVPWMSVVKSMPVWAIIVAHTCSNWGWYMLLVKLPTYMRYILKFDIKANAGLSAVPFLCMWIFTMLLANLLDELRSRNKITTTFARKLATFIASMPPAVCLIGVTYVGCNTDLAVALLTLGTMFVGGMYSGFLSNHIDIAPPFAGTLMGISNTFATIPGIIVPSIVGIVTHGNQTVEAWRFIFFITLGIFTFEAIFYCIFGSGEQQEWAKPKPVPEEEEQQKLNDMA